MFWLWLILIIFFSILTESWGIGAFEHHKIIQWKIIAKGIDTD